MKQVIINKVYDKRLFWIHLLVIFIALSTGRSVAATPSQTFSSEVLSHPGLKNLELNDLALNKEERQWIKQHPSIRIGVDPDWPPVEFINSNKVYDGMAAEFVGLVSHRIGIRFEPVPNLSWSEVIDKIQQKELDVLPAVMKSSERAKYLNFSTTYLNFPMVIITRQDSGLLGGIEDLAGKTVAVVRSYVTQDILEESHPNINLKLAENVAEGLAALVSGEVDAYIGNMASVSYTVNRLGMTELKVAGTTRYSYPLSMGVRKDWPVLVNILNKTLAQISNEEINAIHRRWTSVRVQKGVDVYAIALWSSIVGVAVVILFSFIFFWNRRLALEINRRADVEKKLLQAKNVAEQRLRELAKAKSFLQTVLNNSPAGIIIADAPDGKISYINEAAWSFVGVDAANTGPLSLKKYTEKWRGYHPDGRRYTGNELPLARALHSGEIVKEEEMLVKLNNGTSKWAAACAAPIYGDGNEITSGTIIFVDISKQKVVESELSGAIEKLASANAKLKELDQLKSMFIASVSHELRTPLNSIIGFSGMMRKEVFGSLSEKYKDYAIRINNSGNYLLHLITDVLDISKIESGRIETINSTFDVKDVINEAVKTVRQEANRKGIAIEVDAAQSIKISTDRRRLLQCLLNFLSNAVKYSERGAIKIISETHGNNLRLCVKDTGIGIDQKDLPRLFSPFERIDTHLRVTAGGTGLGLYLTKKIAHDLLHGIVGVESTIGKGSNFWIEVPVSSGLIQKSKSEDYEYCVDN